MKFLIHLISGIFFSLCFSTANATQERQHEKELAGQLYENYKDYKRRGMKLKFPEAICVIGAKPTETADRTIKAIAHMIGFSTGRTLKVEKVSELNECQRGPVIHLRFHNGDYPKKLFSDDLYKTNYRYGDGQMGKDIVYNIPTAAYHKFWIYPPNFVTNLIIDQSLTDEFVVSLITDELLHAFLLVLDTPIKLRKFVSKLEVHDMKADNGTFSGDENLSELDHRNAHAFCALDYAMIFIFGEITKIKKLPTKLEFVSQTINTMNAFTGSKLPKTYSQIFDERCV